MDKKILITGASGYIGRHLLKQLLKKDCQLVVLLRDSNQKSSLFLKNQKLTIVEGDLMNKESLKKATKGIDTVFHLAAVLRMFEKNKELYQTNVVGLENLLSACNKENRQIKLIFASSIDVDTKISDYAKSKLEGERIIKKFCFKKPKLKYNIVRIGNVYDYQGGGMVEGLKKIINQNNWQSSILYHCLGNKILYLIEIRKLIKKLIELNFDEKTINKMITLVDERLTVRKLVTRLKKQKLIMKYPKKLPFDFLVLKIWQTIGKILKRADLLVYLSSEK